jgi:hypothetical protein
MKRYLILALALVVFAVAPAFSQAALASGGYRVFGVWDSGDELSNSGIARYRFNINSKIDDFNLFKSRLASNGGSNAPIVNYTYLVTDWGKYFGFADKGFGLSTTVGKSASTYVDAFEIERVNEFTIYSFDAGDGPAILDQAAIKIDMDIMGIVKPYIATSLRAFDAPAAEFAAWTTNQGDDVKEYIIGALVSFAPVTANAYYAVNGVYSGTDIEKSEFAVDVQFASEVADGIDLTAGLIYRMAQNVEEDYDYNYLFGVGVGAYGAQADVVLMGMTDYALSNMAASVKYGITKWLDVQAGFQMTLGDAVDDFNNGEGFNGMEFGFLVKPGKATYGLGYIVANEDAAGYTPYDGPLNSKALPPKGGMFFTVNTSF